MQYGGVEVCSACALSETKNELQMANNRWKDPEGKYNASFQASLIISRDVYLAVSDFLKTQTAFNLSQYPFLHNIN